MLQSASEFSNTTTFFVSCNLRNLVDKDGHPIPPGPLFRYPYLGQYCELDFDRWARRFGSLVSVWMGDQLCVIISDPRAAQDLLVENGAIFSSRKNYFIKNELILHNRAMTASPYSQLRRQHRRIAMRYLSEKAVPNYVDFFRSEAISFLRSLHRESASCTQPVNPALSAVRFTLNNMLRISFGKRTSSIDDPLLHTIQKLVMEFDDITGPVSNAVDFIKPLQYLPTQTRTRGLNLNSDMNRVYGDLIGEMQRRLDSKEDVPDCLVKMLLETKDEEGLSSEDILMLAIAFAFGGVHSIAGIIQWFLAFMATHPGVSAAAQAEIDRVVGRERLPNNDDEKHSPYVRAIIKERIHSPFWVPTPHYSTADFVYNGMYIPKDTVMILNCWTIHHNEDRYPDAFTFNPDRYLGDDLGSSMSSKLRDPMKRDHWAFGAGRRICPGFAIAERELWISISSLLWAYNFEVVPEEPICLDEYEGSSGRTPLPFRMKLTLRHDAAEKLLEDDNSMAI
ncbi:cytochrome P450 [Mycena albidolilacea]|uniref:Cytochrome P450 n=1 Tax=Mycena albidolilacea TaxID=1033008 RepID=A0AAD7EHV2_9AGAR|nr:cytochrome P450 [Mycena albidolilacea]